MNNGIKTVYFYDSNKCLSSQFLEGYQVQQKAHQEG